jgi:serine/threonine protein kinase
MRRITRTLEGQTGETGQLGQLQPGVTLQDRYLVLGNLGSGGMSSVYKGRDLHFPNVTKLVAIKEMINLASDPTMYEMVVRNFEREADLLATLSHPAIPRIYDYFTADSSSYLIMEFIEGRDLEALLRETTDPVAESQVVAWAIELCDVLTYLHSHQPQPVVFRDVKPSNIMVDHHGHIRLIDFGIARIFAPGQKGTMIGTEGYSPPEQYRGEASPAGDIYALGATLHHLLTRRDPRAEAPFSFSDRPIRQLNPAVSPEVIEVIERALEYDPRDRFAKTEDMKNALLAAARHTGLLVSAKTGTVVQQRSEVQELWSFECEDELRSSPYLHGNNLYIGCYDNNLYAFNSKNGEFLWKYPTEGGISGRPAAFDDLVYVGSEDQRLHAVTANRGKLAWTYYTEGPIRSSLAIWEGHIFLGSDDGHVHVVNVANGRRAWRAEAAGPVRSTPCVADERVYFGCETGDFYCVDLRGELKWRFRAKRAVTSSPIIVENVVYFGSMDWTLYAIEAEGGWQLWRFRMGKPTISSPTFAEGKIFIGCADNNIYAIDSRSARESWRFATEHQVTGSPVVHEDSVYVGSVDGSLYCLDMRSGRKRWQFATGGPITGTPLIANGVVYIGSTDHKVYALQA